MKNWGKQNIMQIPESEKAGDMHFHFARKENVKNLLSQGYVKCDSKNSNISEPKRGEMIIMQIPKKDAEEKRAFFRSQHQEKVINDRETQKEMAGTVYEPRGRRLA